METVIQESSAGQRIDIFLQQQLNCSRQKVQQFIKKGLVQVNGKVIKASYKIQEQDKLTVQQDTADMTQESSQEKPMPKLDYLYEDECLIVIHKPVNCIVQQGVDANEATLLDALKQDARTLGPFEEDQRNGIVHRLDRMTEGLLVVAKNKAAYQQLTKQFKERQVTKKYYALLKGNVDNDELHINQPIARNPKERHKYLVLKEGKEAITDIKVLKRYNSMTLCSIQIKTGRTHQIRVHCKFIGHPVLDDPIYGSKSKGLGQRLQAYYLSFDHPIHGKRLSFELPLSDRLKTA